jgi:ABC-2 type transport system ATP-binding protein
MADATAATSDDRPLVLLSGVHRSFEDNGLHGVDLEVPAGTIFGLVGPSGSGKTTAVRIMLGLDEPDQGRVFVFGRPPSAFDRSDLDRIGYMSQSISLYPELSLRHNLDFVASLYGMPWRGRWLPGRRRRAARKRVDEVLALLGLEDNQRTRLSDASGGEQRRLALAAALIHEPALLVLDEPTAGIDPVLRRAIWERLGDLRESGVTVFVTTQYVEEAANCDLVSVLANGEVVITDRPEDLRRRAFGAEPPADATFEDVFVALLRRYEDHRRAARHEAGAAPTAAETDGTGGGPRT